MQPNVPGIVSKNGLIRRVKTHVFAELTGAQLGQVVASENNILGGYGNRPSRGRQEDIVGRQHQHFRFKLGFKGERNMDRHLVAVEVGIKGGAGQWMQLDGLALHQHRVKGLDAQTVEGRGTIEHDRVVLDNLF